MSDRWGVYVHVPWCRVQCAYCAFHVTTGKAPPDPMPWRDGVLAEWAARRPAFPAAPPVTLYLGGGTPSRVDASTLGGLVRAVGATEEVTVEANPEDLDEAWLEGVVEAGVHRVSVGVQSFSPSLRKRLGRAWVDREPQAALGQVARSPLRSWSVDLIFAVPGQTLADLDHELDAIERIAPPHVALYGLTIEPGTALARAHARGQIQAVDDDLWRQLYDRLVERLQSMGLDRYEVSNFARPGHRSLHNQLYWNDRPYLGLGPAAHSYLPSGERSINAPHLPDYLLSPTEPAHLEQPDPIQRFTDTLVSGLRSVEGVDLHHLAAHTHLRPSDAAVSALGPLVVHEPSGRLRLTAEGFPLCDAIVARLAAAAIPTTK